MNTKKDIGPLLKKAGYGIPITPEEIKDFEERFESEYESPETWPDIEGIISKVTFDNLKYHSQILVKPVMFLHHRKMKVTKMVGGGYSISNYGEELINGREYMFKVYNQVELDRLNPKSI
ncbi:hypothetical protein [Flagellimonas sp.]|uniref:hypothetical protein n=1 Tax=Flagellimonas sp. TaxID=2058762 RepID=UPI003BACCA45